MCLLLSENFLLHCHVCGTHVGSTTRAVIVLLKRGHKDEFPHIHHSVKLEDFNALCGVPFTDFVSMQAASLLCACVCVCVYKCIYARPCGSLYLVGIRPLALVLITVCSDLAIFHLSNVGLKKKKRINPLAVIVSTLSLFQPTLEVTVPVAPPRTTYVSCHLSQQAGLLLAN